MKYNPGFLTDDELASSFCVRESELESILETLRGCTAESNAHTIIIGSRGSGKTTLLLRAAAEARRDPALSGNLFPVVFPEESYEIGSCGEFWLACLGHLADRAPRREDARDLQRSYEDLRAERDDRRLADRCLGAALGFAEREGKRLVLVVENLNMIFADMRGADDAWRLRHTLQTEPRIVLLASATSRFQQIDDRGEAFYGFFRSILLRPLDTGECAALWEAVSGRRPAGRSVRSMQILTGGNARLIAIVARFDSRFAFSALMDGLLKLIDDHTDYFKGHLDGLPAQERRVYLALAELWKPATTREIADRARLGASACSTQLRRLCERGAVEEDGGTRRRKRYYVTERLYNIYYLLRKRQGGAGHVVEVLIRFMSSYYSPTQLMDIGARIARDAATVGDEMRALHVAALKRLIAEPRLARYKDRILTETPAAFFASPAVSDNGEFGKSDRKSSDFLEKIDRFADSGQILKALRAYNDFIGEFDSGQDAAVIRRIAQSFNKKFTMTLILEKGYEEIVNIVDNVVRNFNTHIYPDFNTVVSAAIIFSGAMVMSKSRPEKALEIFDAAWRRFSDINHPIAEFVTVHALQNKGFASSRMDLPCEALKIYDEIIEKFKDSNNSLITPLIADTFVDKGYELKNMDRIDESLNAADEALQRFHNTEDSQFDISVARAFVIKSGALNIKGMREESRAALKDTVRIFCQEKNEIKGTIIIRHLVSESGDLVRRGMLDEPLDFIRAVEEIERICGLDVGGSAAAAALASIGSNFVGAGRYEESLNILDDAIRRFEKTGTDDRFFFVQAFRSKGRALDAMDKKEEALLVYSDAINKFDGDDKEDVRLLVGIMYIRKCSTLIEIGRMDEALDVLDKITDRADTFDRAWPHMQPDSGSVFSEQVGRLLLKVALHWLTNGRFADARAAASRALDVGFAEPADRIDGHSLCAVASSLMGDRASSESDIVEALRILPEAEDRVKFVVKYLLMLCRRFHESDILGWISESPSSMLLLPMTVALRRELGEDPEVAREVSEVADDIRNDLARMKANSSETRFGENLDEVDSDN